VIQKRQAKTASEAPVEVKSNPWATEQAADDLPLPLDPTIIGSAPADFAGAVGDMNLIEDFSPDNIDWRFWDQLIQDSGSLPPALDFRPQ
jgi:hypothetical protein